MGDRLDQLAGTPELDPATLVSRAQTECTTPVALLDVIIEGVVAEGVVIRADGEALVWWGPFAHRRIVEEILAEEEHADDMLTLLPRVSSAVIALSRPRSMTSPRLAGQGAMPMTEPGPAGWGRRGRGP